MSFVDYLTSGQAYIDDIRVSTLAIWTGHGGPGSAQWDVAANWSDNFVPANGDVTFGTSFNNGNTIELNGNRTVQLLTFTNTSTTPTWPSWGSMNPARALAASRSRPTRCS